MHRLRHPIRSITEPYGKAGLIVAILALVLATTGAAFAAAGLSSKQKKEVTKIAKKYAGKPGINGTNGTNGSNGAAGEKGAPGAPGEPGKNGESVKVTESANAAIEGHCTGAEASPVGKGGSKFEVGASKAYACNGKEGSPWTAGGTLPSGKTETGAWATVMGPEQPTPPHFSVGSISVPFNIPLTAALPAANIHVFPVNPTLSQAECEEKPELAEREACEATLKTEEEKFQEQQEAFEAACPGSASEPQAPAGNLCIYKSTNATGATSKIVFLNSRAGVVVFCLATAAHKGNIAFGTWAVTAE